ncbi:MAG: ATP synthase epsilon chain [Candidatus Magasanikbacteria bacterium GW2011_GWC2_40_17]|uniref:ATP synthase epsilon chain n=1 Tax=Candidatus Magasanikbacteria bacterium GW2011_GWA2_42_32 TaxID=1619039 RepID=A0A0G1A974_9BACT|nr:MAG: ATP synthase epsilon chain [Candidatus Magasanikbacteria bacterium GW2011_GWC2_40_17]KKS57514.1 MAG: ATP synthase epsilon chain [Candidatus Magasanikbacteria bacterium GW2011_GWA2_42_32]OGH85230.1 MAG: ATP synthase F1 subunit epsilon [Candidatus Magasanikbacteria bacterium RIFOXYB2_FULL_38_10]
MQKIDLQITTPEGVAYKASDIDAISLPTSTGEITILPGHIPLVSALIAGEARIKRGEETEFLAVSGGFIEVQPNFKVVVLADTAERAEHIDIDRAKKARQKAEELMKQKHVNDVEYAALTSKIEREMARVKVARRHKAHRTPGEFIKTDDE